MGLFRKITDTIKDYYFQDYIKRNNLALDMYDAVQWNNAFPAYNNSDTQDDYSSFAYSCINVRAEKLSEGKPFLFRYLGNGKIKEVQNHQFLNLYNTVNIYNQSGNEIDYLIATSLDLFGNSFVYYARNRFNIPKQLILIPSNKMRIDFNPDYTEIISYTYLDGARSITYSKDEILHFKIPNPYNNLVGKSTVSACKISIDTDYFQRMYNKNFYKNDTALGMILSSPEKISDANYERLKNALREKYSGYQNSGKHIILDNGMTATKIEATARESQANENRKQIRDEILALFKVPKSILGYTDDVNRANAESSRISFMQNTIIPFSRVISNTWQNFIKVNYDERLNMEYDYNIVQDVDTVLKTRQMNAQYNILTIDELRQEQGYESLSKNLNQNNETETN